MKEGWTYKKLGEVVKPINGLWKGKKEPFVHVGVIRNANFTKDFTLNFDNIEYLDVEQRQYATRKLKKGDLIVEKSGGSEKQPVGRAVLFLKDEGEFSFSNFTSVLRITDANSLSYLFLYKYLLFVYKRGDTKKMQNAATGIHNIIWDMYLGIDVPIPSISEQERIVAYLDAQFAKIDAMKANAAKALAEAKALFQAALTEAMTPKEGWKEKTLEECSIISGNYGLSVPSKPFDGVRYLRITDITDMGGLNGDKVSADLDSKSKQEKLEEGDILFARTGATVGKTLLYKNSMGPCLFAGYLIRYRLNQSLIKPQYLYYITHSKTYYQWVADNQKAAAQPNISAKTYNLLPLQLPPLPEQQRIVTRLDALSGKVAALEGNYTQTVAECDALKQALLREVFE